MNWAEKGYVISARPHGETSAVLELFTRGQGRWMGLVRGGRGKRMRPVLQTGNVLQVQWRARLAEHLGTFTAEPVQMNAARLIDDPVRLAALTTLAALTQLLPEREQHARLYDAFEIVLDTLLAEGPWPPLLVRWELGLLEELGFGLDLATCAATGVKNDLIYVSPKSGRAVSREAGDPYQDKMLALPGFVIGKASASISDVEAGFALTGYFLDRHIFHPRGLKEPEARGRMIARLVNASTY
ncbi:MAG: DNA repair protein RecO [Hyphomicrobiales bacterium]